MVTTLLALELERSRAPDWQSEEVAGVFVAAVLGREVTDRGDIVARAAELGADLERGAGVLIVRAAPRAAQTGEWRARVLTLAMRALRSLAAGRAGDAAEDGEVAAEIAVIVPAEDEERLARAAAGARARARGRPRRLPPDDRRQPPRRRPGRPLPGRQRGAAGGQRRRGRGPPAARLRGHRRLPPAAAGDERGPGRAGALLRRDDRAARPPTTTSTRPSWSRPSRPTSTTTATSPPPPNSSSPTATRSATGSSACASSAATTSPPPRAARSSASASRRCASSASPPARPGAGAGRQRRAKCRAAPRSRRPPAINPEGIRLMANPAFGTTQSRFELRAPQSRRWCGSSGRANYVRSAGRGRDSPRRKRGSDAARGLGSRGPSEAGSRPTGGNRRRSRSTSMSLGDPNRPFRSDAASDGPGDQGAKPAWTKCSFRTQATHEAS